jgi:hypothetical protein
MRNLTIKERGLRAGGVAQVFEHPPNKCKTLSSNPSNVKKKKKKRKGLKANHTHICNPSTPQAEAGGS